VKVLLPPNVLGFIAAVPLVAGVLGAVILTRPGKTAGETATTTPSASATASPMRTPTPPATATRAAPTATPTRPAPIPTATQEILRPLTGIRFGTIEVVSNSTGVELPSPAEFAISSYFVMEPGGDRVRYGLDSAPFMPVLTGESVVGPEWSDRGGHGIATGSGKFLGIATDWTMDFFASENVLTALITIGRSGNLPGGRPVELSISVAQAWQAAP